MEGNSNREGLKMNLYRNESSNVKHNAQRNLMGRTHYVDDETLRFHESRVSYSEHKASGLLFALITKERCDGYRFTIFDVFGFVADRHPVDSFFPTKKAAEKAMDEWLSLADAKAITREAIRRETRNHARDMERLTLDMEKVQL